MHKFTFLFINGLFIGLDMLQLINKILSNFSFSSFSDSEEINAYVKEITKEITAEIKSEIREVINLIDVEDGLENSDHVDMHRAMAHISRYSEVRKYQ